jgi:hypothetical protein
MSDQKKERSEKVVPRDLPMPEYDYQKPASGSLTVLYDEQKSREREGKRDKAPALQNHKLSL